MAKPETSVKQTAKTPRKVARKKAVRKADSSAAPKKVAKAAKRGNGGNGAKLAKAASRVGAKTPAKKAAKGAAGPVRAGRRTIVRRSPIHGLGVFAGVDIAKGERVIEYKARKITWAQADRWYADDESKPSHTFLFTLDDKYVLDGNKDGNSARWINHSCKPNCESDVVDGRIWIEALRNIKAGEELNYDYNITLDAPHTPAEKRRWSCRCGSANCRGTLLGKKR